MNITIEGKVAFVSGGASGLGRAITLKLIESGAKVIFTSRNNNELTKLIDLVGDKHLGINADVTKEEDLEKAYQITLSKYGTVDILINNVGHTMEVTSPDVAKEIWMKVMDLNFLTHVSVTNKFLPLMKKKDWGRIVNITSIAGLEVSGPAPFNAAKAALTAYTRSLGRLLAMEYKNIVMTAVAPGVVVTDGGHWEKILKENSAHAEKYLKERTAAGRFGTVDEVTDIVVFLSSDKASFFQGSIIQVDGGQSRHYFSHTYME
jgi:3-oxoacyl-[acyl-carrier protein] reductase